MTSSGVIGENSYQRILAILALAAVSFSPFLVFLEANWGNRVDIGRLTFYGGTVWLAAIAASNILSLVASRRFVQMAQPIAASVYMFFTYAFFTKLFDGQGDFGKETLALWALATGAVFIAFWRFSKSGRALYFVTFLAASMITVPAVGLAVKMVAQVRAANEPHNSSAADLEDENILSTGAFAENKNVYLLVVDAYARADTLMDELSYDNAAFLSALENRGFDVATNSTANFLATSHSIPSILNMRYDHLLGAADYNAILHGQNVVVDRLKSAGYRYAVAQSNIWQKIECGHNEDICMNGSGPFSQEMNRVLVSLTPLDILYKLPSMYRFLPGTSSIFLEPEDVQRRLDTLQVPVFLLAHFGTVHEATYEVGCKLGERYGSILRKSEDVTNYVRSIDCTNKQILPLVDEIISRDAAAIIVLLSDHGPFVGMHRTDIDQYNHPSLWPITNQRDFRNRYGNLTSVRLPEKCSDSMPDDVSLVNIMEIVFACLENRAPQLHETRWFFPEDDTNEQIELYPDTMPTGR